MAKVVNIKKSKETKEDKKRKEAIKNIQKEVSDFHW